MNTRPLSFALTAVLAFAAAACSGSVADEPTAQPADAEESALSTNDLAGVAAVRVDQINNVVLLGAPAKVTKFMKAFRKSGAVPLCNMMQRPTKFTFYDAKGEDMGNGSVMCFRGSIHLKSGKDIEFVTRPGDFDVLQEPFVVADALWGLTKIHGRSHASKADLTTKAEIDSVLDAVGVTQKLGPMLPRMRCMSSHSIDFYRGELLVANAAYNCGEDAPTKLEVNFMAFDPAGAADAAPAAQGSISIHAKAIDALVLAAAPPAAQ